MPPPPVQPHRRRAPRHPVGQSLTEYAIIVFLIAVGTIGVVGLFGNNLRSLFAAGADALAGETTVEPGATKTTSGLTKWSMKGGDSSAGFSSGGTANRAPGGGGGNPGGVANSTKPGGDGPGSAQ